MVNCLLFKLWLVALLIKVCLADLGYYRIWLFVFANLLCCLAVTLWLVWMFVDLLWRLVFV